MDTAYVALRTAILTLPMCLTVKANGCLERMLSHHVPCALAIRPVVSREGGRTASHDLRGVPVSGIARKKVLVLQNEQ